MDSPVITDHTAGAQAPARDAPGDRPVVIEVRDLDKAFRIPDQRIDSLKERATHPFTRVHYRRLRALREISFDIHQGEFFGIVGRNGSGKSTLLKILASIYRADAGRVRMAGRLAPFIELGVGFNPEMTARENVVLNGVLMGLSRREALRRLDAVIDFAELQEFTDLKLKNYSSGMMVRLAFAIMVQADADIMLIDEVLAVGDAAFAQKCMDVFHERRRAGKTIVLVTHDMSTVQSMCHRAMLLHDGELRFIGAPEEAALRYFRLNFDTPEAQAARPPGELPALMDLNVRIVQAGLRNPLGERVENVEQSMPLRLDVVIEAARELDHPELLFHIVSEAGVVVSAFTRRLDHLVPVGGRLRISGEVENLLVPGRYYLDCWVGLDDRRNVTVQAIRLLQFLVYGTAPRFGVVALRNDIEAKLVENPGDRGH